MALVYNATLKGTRMQDVLNAIDAAAPVARLKIYNAGFVSLLLDFFLGKPSFSRSGGTLTMLGVPFAASGLANDQAVSARIYDGNGILVVDQLSVGQNAANIIITSSAITIGQPNQIQSGIIVHG